MSDEEFIDEDEDPSDEAVDAMFRHDSHEPEDDGQPDEQKELEDLEHTNEDVYLEDD